MKLLTTVPVGRVGVSMDALPLILPVNFVVVEDWIVFRTVPGTKLDAAVTRSVVAFQADGYALDGSWGWSVLAQGYAHEVTDEAKLGRITAMKTWPFQHGEANHVVAIIATTISGRQFGTVPALHAAVIEPTPARVGSKMGSST